MTVPSSGEISLGKIRQELESTSTSNDYNEGPYTGSTSLSASETGVYDTLNSGSSNRPDGVGPFKMSEWRSYGHNIGWSVSWGAKFRSMPNGYFLLSGSRSNENTAPNNTVADQQVATFTITNPSSGTITPPAGYSWDNVGGGEPRASYVYVYISDAHANGEGTYVDSGSVHIAVGIESDPGVAGTAAGGGPYSKVAGTGWILTGRKAGTDPTAADFVDISGSTPSGDPPRMLNVARLYVNPGYQTSSFYVRMAYSGSGDNTYGFTGATNYGVPGTYHSRSIHVINGQYSSSQDFKTTIVS